MVPDCFVGSMRFNDVEGGILFRLLTPVSNVLSHFGLYKVAERRRLVLVLVSLASYRATEIDWS